VKEIPVEALLQEMMKAAAASLDKKWPKARDYAESEFRKLLLEAGHIQQLKKNGRITEAEAVYLIDLQRNASRTVLLTLEGLGLIAAETAINAALGAVRKTLNRALGGWKIF
jgi:hypothetical protein